MHDAHNALWGPKTLPPGVRPGSLAEPGPQRSDRSVRCSSGDSLPTLALPALAGSAGEAVDSSALRFLTALALEAKRKAEEEEQEKAKELKKRMKVWLEQRTAEARRELEQKSDSGGASSKRKKKRRRKRLPKASSSRLRRGACSSVSGCCLKSTRFGSWEMTSGSSPITVLSWFGSGYSTCVSRRCFWLLFHIFLCEGGHRFLDQMDILAASPWRRSSSTPALTCVWLFYWFAPRVAFPSVLSGPRCSASWPV